MSETWRKMSAAALGRGIDAGEICPLDLTESFLDAIEAHPHRDRIYTQTMRLHALEIAAAARARAKSGQRRGPLDGVPVSWKDLFDTANVPTEAGSLLLKGRMPARDALVVDRLTEAGLPPLGKTHMTELAFSGLGLNPVTQTPPLIHDPARVPGGSSSGAAASIAWDLAPLAIGSDTGGSVRVPAAWNDLVGLKTTAGRIPLTGCVPLAERFDTVGPLARTVEDAALAFSLLDGSAPVDLRGAALGGLRLLVLESVAFDDIHPAPAEGFDAALDAFGKAGAVIDHAKIPAVDEAMTLAGILYTSECYGIWGETIELTPDVMFPPVRDRFRAGAAHNASDYVAGWRRLERLRAEWHAAVAGYDAVLIPSVPNVPPLIDDLMADLDLFASENLMALRNTRIGNLMGLCALTLPTGVASAGVMLMAGPGDEARLLRVGAAAEAALGL
ncbi:amidase [Rhodobacter sp. NTK016B]|uniref:amidase n=1 Tax=Rhodobacter sp. NTK016B TaxID=2759676 RepID=UPI0025708DAD|nr:amidase family protein [Rhodobacter sp. NTK016B]